MKYTSINIQGNLISEEILQKIEDSESSGQLAKDFGFEAGINIRSEIEYAWSKIKLDWKYFSDRTEKLPSSDPYGTSLSRKWMISFLGSLGFDLALQKASLQGANHQLYNISHTSTNLDEFPVHIVGFLDPSHPEKNTLDIRSSGGTSRLSPHATIQEYLNVTEYVYGMATNGLVLRLIRDSGHLVRMTYIEFDLKRLLEEDKYSEFTLLYRMLHPSRFPKTRQEEEPCFFERYYHDSIESGNRIRDGLSDAVKESLVALGNGLLEHPDNDVLREKVSQNLLNAREFYHQLLRLIYRLLFLMVTEERDLVYPETQHETKGPDPEDLLNGTKRPTRKQKEIYYNYYSVARLRRLSQKRYLLEDQYHDLWQSLMQTFALFESGGAGLKLGIQALGSELFSHIAMPDISTARINNRVLLKCIKSLNEFEDEKHNLSFINYRALDVEELGSVYEGLLELEPLFESENGKPKFTFRRGSERSKSGSHYTPEDLVKPLIQHSLDYLIEERVAEFYKGKSTEEDTRRKLLDLKVCDVACGSGHILLSAARRIALEVARVETGEQQPNPASFRHSLKEVIKNCIYGVDKNPLAVELCKVALWLESHNPGEPLSFLDHKIKCGDAIVGLAHREELQNGIADEAFKKLPGDDKKLSSIFLKKNKQERTIREKSRQEVQLTTETDHKLMEKVSELNRLIENFSSLSENTLEEIEKKEKSYRILVNSNELRRLRIIADLQIMPFFLQKTESTKDLLLTDLQYFRYLRGESRIPDATKMKAFEESAYNKFFHWFLEFPEVFQQGGFNCVLGNPPYLGGKRISGYYGESYLNYLKTIYAPSEGSVDLISYFVRRYHSIISKGSIASFISTNSISQGDTKKSCLDFILQNQSEIIFAHKNIRWPGLAAVDVTLLSLYQGIWERPKFIKNKVAINITTLLDDDLTEFNPYHLVSNENKSFQGSIIFGDGFLLTNNEASSLINDNSKYSRVLFPYLIGDDINNSFQQANSRSVINFFDWTKEKCSLEFGDLLHILEEKVKPERDKVKRKAYREKWWLYAEKGINLYKAIKNYEKVLVISQTTKYLGFSFVQTNQVFAGTCIVFAFPKYKEYCVLQSSFHESWVWKFPTTMGSSTLRYVNSKCFETYPFPQYLLTQIEEKLEFIGECYYEYRKKLMSESQLGLTKMYNAFHSKGIGEGVLDVEIINKEKKFIEKQFSRDGWNLWNHLQKTEGTCSFEEAVRGIMKLRELHVEMDNAVLVAYGWQDIDLRHDFYEVDYLPENDRVRFTIHPDARKEVLKRLLELNHKIHEEEVKAGLWESKKTKKKKTENLDPNGDQVSDPEVGYGGLFG